MAPNRSPGNKGLTFPKEWLSLKIGLVHFLDV